ncbi:hypothetical protein C1645_295657 [Glomus cerebriforme]|uniref:Uncharacterized protein n=1 Tax=Glomus cerebriforme TaxID=658196 RepID=A0A397SMK5_9GLOM|nr:hypothetical protein C1645_295657 [Glomus cerebriforme]
MFNDSLWSPLTRYILYFKYVIEGAYKNICMCCFILIIKFPYPLHIIFNILLPFFKQFIE